VNNTVLIVEDDAMLRKLYENVLERESIPFIEATNGEEGLAKALSEHPALILLDVIMPKMDGISMLKKLREDSWGHDVEVIMLTNLGDARQVATALANGVHDYLIKADWKIEDLMGIVKQKLHMSP
jgi:DNA-binding response OmpR family regulator